MDDQVKPAPTQTPSPSAPDQSLPTPQPSSTSSKPSNRAKSIVLFALMLVVVAAGAAIYAVATQTKTTLKTVKSTTVPAPAVISITDAGFVPANLSIKVGTTITWTNNDTKPHRVASDPYPTNNGLAGFDSQEALQPNDQYSYKFEKAGNFGYHDDLHPYDIKATVVVTP